MIDTYEKTDKILAREMPHNILAEQLVLGSILNMNENLMRVGDLIEAESFYVPIHNKIYDMVVKLSDKGLRADPITLKNHFDHEEAFQAVGGGDYLIKLASLAASSIVNIADYAKTINDLYLKRKLIVTGQDIVNNAYDHDADYSAMEQIESAEAMLFTLANDKAYGSTGFISLKASLMESLKRTESAKKLDQHISGISTGFSDMDDLLGGMQNSDLIILAARPSMGKTALAVNIALNAAKFLYEQHEKTPDTVPAKAIGFFSLEMSAEQLASRIISMETRVPSNNLRLGRVTAEDFKQVTAASRQLYQLPFFIDDTPALSISALRTRARRLKRKNDLGLLIVDYLQLLTGSSKSRDSNRVNEISEITQGLKAIAKELNIPVIALSQLSRAVESRDDKRPQLSDLRESGSIEQDADIVMFIYREQYYLERKRPQNEGDKEMEDWQNRMNQVANTAEVIVSKQRNGPIGSVTLYFDHAYTKFSNLARG